MAESGIGATAASRGAWPFYYEAGLDRRDDPGGRDAYGIFAFKAELVYNGFSKGINPLLALWGDSAVARTRDAQKAFGVQVDGVLGPETARCLFRHRASAAEAASRIPAHWLARIKSLESGNDPVAQGEEDPDDEGLLQENGPSNPTITQIQCWTPSFILPYGGQQLVGRIAATGSVKAGVAAWNVGNYAAAEWAQAGFPASGVYVTIGGAKVDVAPRATTYYNDVQAQAL
jgi:hypothetical protein